MNKSLPEEALTVGGVVASLLVTFGVIDAAQLDVTAHIIGDIVTGTMALFVIYHLVSQNIQNRHEKWMVQNTGNAAGTDSTTPAPTTVINKPERVIVTPEAESMAQPSHEGNPHL